MKKLLLFGAGKLAEKVLLYNKRDSFYDICGFIDDNPSLPKELHGLPVCTFEKALTKYDRDSFNILVTIGYTKCNTLRQTVCKRMLDSGYNLVNYISPLSNVWNDTIKGRNIFVGDGTFIGHGCTIESGCIIYENTTLCHDVHVGENCFISGGVVVGGDAIIGNNCFVGLNSTIIDAAKIGSYNIIGCGSNVVKDTIESCVVKGNPAAAISKDTIAVEI